MDIKMLTSVIYAICIYHIGRELLFIIWSRSHPIPSRDNSESERSISILFVRPEIDSYTNGYGYKNTWSETPTNKEAAGNYAETTGRGNKPNTVSHVTYGKRRRNICFCLVKYYLLLSRENKSKLPVCPRFRCRGRQTIVFL